MLRLKQSEQTKESGKRTQETLAKAMGLPSANPLPVVAPRGPTVFIKEKTGPGGSEDEGSDLSEDEAEIVRKLREKRMSELKKQSKAQERLQGHGEYNEIKEEEFLDTVRGSARVVCHFYHREFERCRIVDKHLRFLAKKHRGTRFVRLDAEKAPFFVAKLVVRTLPTMILFDDAKAVDRIVGFDELGGKDDFSTAVLERRLGRSGVIKVKVPKARRVGKRRGPVSKNIRLGTETAGDWSGSDSD